MRQKWDVFSKSIGLNKFTYSYISNLKVTKIKNKKEKVKKKPSDPITYTDLPIKQVGNKYVFKYIEKRDATNQISFNRIINSGMYHETKILGYFQEFELGWIFISLDTSHVWKRVREIILKTEKNVFTVGNQLVFCNIDDLEYDKRYYFYDKNGDLDPNSFIVKLAVARINDIYILSNKTSRVFLVSEHVYTSSDFLTNNYLMRKHYFESLKDLSNEELIMIFNQNDLSDQEEISKRYNAKMLNKLLKC